MPSFDLASYGDPVERVAWQSFLRNKFPQYEAFWQVFVVGLTGRIRDSGEIAFLEQCELDQMERPPWHVAIAQLHYTTLLHLVRGFEIRQRMVGDRDSFMEAIVRLSAATDTAFELLGRCLLDSGQSDPWSEDAGQKFRRDWQKREKSPLKLVRDYRNALVHGRAPLQFEHMIVLEGRRHWTRVSLFPTLEKMSGASDWREAKLDDSAPADNIVEEVWLQVLGYLRESWDEFLLPWARKQIPEPPMLPVTTQPDATWTRPPSGPASTEGQLPYLGGSVTWFDPDASST